MEISQTEISKIYIYLPQKKKLVSTHVGVDVTGSLSLFSWQVGVHTVLRVFAATLGNLQILIHKMGFRF